MAIEVVMIRAKISIGAGLVVETPFIRSFNVNKARGQISTFNAVLKVRHDAAIGGPGDQVTIDAEGFQGSAGEPNIRIFTGIVRQAKISPCFDDPYFVDFSISGNDVMSLLQNKKYTRRCRSSKASFITIDAVTRPGLKSGKFKYKQQEVLETSLDGPVQNGDVPYAPYTVPVEPTKAASKPQANIIVTNAQITTTTTTEGGGQ